MTLYVLILGSYINSGHGMCTQWKVLISSMTIVNNSPLMVEKEYSLKRKSIRVHVHVPNGRINE